MTYQSLKPSSGMGRKLTSDGVEGNIVDMLVPAELGISNYDGGSESNTAYL